MDRNSINEQLDRAYSILTRADVPDEVEHEANQAIDDVIGELVRREGDGAYTRHVTKVLGREHERKRRGERDKPLCACSDSLCPLSQGRLPPQLRPQRSRHFADRSAKELIDEYEETHPEAVILREARREWERSEATIERRLRRLIADLKQHRQRNAANQFTKGL